MTILPEILERLQTQISADMVNGGRTEFGLHSLTCSDGLHGMLRAVRFGPDGTAIDAAEREHYLGPLELLPDLKEWPPELDDAIAALRESMKPWLTGEFQWLLERAWPALSLTQYLGHWLSKGPPAARPERFAEPNKIARQLSAYMSVTTKKWENGVCAILNVGEYCVHVGAATADSLGCDLWLVDPQGARWNILRYGVNDLHNSGFEPFDADTVTMRGVLEILVQALVLADADTDVLLQDPNGDDWHDAFYEDEVLLSRILQYRAAEGPVVDWRLQGDAVGIDTLQDGHSASLRETHRDTARVFDAFVREHFDPSFKSHPFP